MPSLLDEVIERINGLTPAQIKKLDDETRAATAGRKWIPNPGPQTEAYYCPADLLLYGGQGGGGKSSLINGLSLTAHRRSLIMRRHYTDLGALIDECLVLHGSRDGFNGSPPPKLRTADDRLIEFGACARLGDEQHWQGRAHDFLGVDEAVQFIEAQIRFLMGWVRHGPKVPLEQRTRTVLASNPPVTAEGQWIVGMFRPWLDPTHHNPARHGELRWFVTDPDGKDMEVDGPDDIKTWNGKDYAPKSRTFIPAALSDNPFLVKTGYQATLDSLPEPLRAAVRDGNFMAAREDAANQVIPAAWVFEAQKRWVPQAPAGIPMCAIGVDVAQGGVDQTILAPRHDGWFAPLIAVPGKKTPGGREVAGIIVQHRRDGAVVIVDCGGGYGGSTVEQLRENDVECVAYKGAEASNRRTKDRLLAFYNKRSEAIWTLREALDPEQPGGSPIALPDDPEMVADLTAPTFEVTSRGIQVESKEDVVGRLGRSTDKGDAVVMSWYGGQRGLVPGRLQGRRAKPTVITKRDRRGGR